MPVTKLLYSVDYKEDKLLHVCHVDTKENL